LLQQSQRELLVDHVVFGQQDAQRVARGRLRIHARLGRGLRLSGCAVAPQQRDQGVEELALAQRLGQGGGEQAVAGFLAAQ